MTHLKECTQCGTCCEKGGPALHHQDLPLIEKGSLSVEDLITIRKGELVHYPATNTIKPAKTEFLKIKGTKGSWACTFYNKTSRKCTRYDNRPLSCGALKCWDTEESLKLAGKNLVSRLDVVKENDPMREQLIAHELLFPLPDLEALSRPSKKRVKKLEQICNKEIAHRIKAVGEFHLSVAQEVFYFGRPIFGLLAPLGFIVKEAGTGIKLRFR
ncbi:MAG: YkgJ family cysteine cluster protein [Proteobacteria bacterium]|nr:YkgJ family cysteine cluster protein [Pseudomonadota bacterium]MBU4131421.1 YkgJ family cysteine cluster protein [Pseudomonadota bacterium]